jgi:hypothetical protein
MEGCLHLHGGSKLADGDWDGKINKDYTLYNMMRNFGFTSWAHTDELFLWFDICTKKVENLEIIDRAKCGWDYENATSSHFKESHQWSCGQISLNLFLLELCNQYVKMDLVQREACPWGHASAFTTSCAWLAYFEFVDFVPSIGLPSTNASTSFLALLHTCH